MFFFKMLNQVQHNKMQSCHSELDSESLHCKSLIIKKTA